MDLKTGDRIVHNLTGQTFVIIGNAINTETGGICTVYRCEEDDFLRVRNADDFDGFKKIDR